VCVLFWGCMWTVCRSTIPTSTSTLQDVDEAGNNFLLPSLKRLCINMTQSKIVNPQRMLEFECLLSNKFPSLMIWDDDDEEHQDDNDDDDDEVDDVMQRKHPRNGGHVLTDSFMNSDDDDDDDDDGPVVVDLSDVEASMARSNSTWPGRPEMDGHWNAASITIKDRYPFLAAAILPHEDIMMTCARALDEKNDVSLVREAAAYLEEIDRQK